MVRRRWRFGRGSTGRDLVADVQLGGVGKGVRVAALAAEMFGMLSCWEGLVERLLQDICVGEVGDKVGVWETVLVVICLKELRDVREVAVGTPRVVGAGEARPPDAVLEDFVLSFRAT